jgi:hypothetical protein
LAKRNAKAVYFVEEDSCVVGDEDGYFAFGVFGIKKVLKNKKFDSLIFEVFSG